MAYLESQGVYSDECFDSGGLGVWRRPDGGHVYPVVASMTDVVVFTPKDVLFHISHSMLYLSTNRLLF
jgi:hypothetical protein